MLFRRIESLINIFVSNFRFVKADTNSSKSVFIAKGSVIAKPPEDTTDVSGKTMEDAIEAGAEEVEPSEDVPGHFQVSEKVFVIPGITQN